MPQYSVLTHNGKEYKVFNFRSFVGGCAGRVGRPGCPVAPLGMAFRPSRYSVSGWVAVIAFQERTAANQSAMHWAKIMDCMIACRRIDDHFEVSVPCLPPIAIFPYPFDMKRLRSPHAWLGLRPQTQRYEMGRNATPRNDAYCAALCTAEILLAAWLIALARPAASCGGCFFALRLGALPLAPPRGAPRSPSPRRALSAR